MSELQIKICGLRELEHARAAVDAGADALGFVFAATRRYVSPEVVESIGRQLPTAIPRVGLFVDEHPEVIRSIVAQCGLAYAELCGDESLVYCAGLGVPFVKSFRVRGAEIVDEVGRYSALASWCKLDSYVPAAYGGTGITFDWNLARVVASRYQIMVAGGLTPANVGDAIRLSRPWGVDVSSGVETNGRKDVEKIALFVAAARQAERQIAQTAISKVVEPEMTEQE